MKFNRLIPELSVANIRKSIDFYTSLGFRIRYERKEDRFCFLELEKNQLMIEEINDNWNTGSLEYPFGRGINISMTIDDIETFYSHVKSLGHPLFKELMVNKYKVEDIVYEDKEFLIQDPNGYLLRFHN